MFAPELQYGKQRETAERKPQIDRWSVEQEAEAENDKLSRQAEVREDGHGEAIVVRTGHRLTWRLAGESPLQPNR